MGANQSSELSADPQQTSQHGITIVNPSPGLTGTRDQIVLPSRVAPVLSIEGYNLDPKRHGPDVQLNHELWLDVVDTIDRFTNSRAELIASRQNQLQEKISFVDRRVQKFTDSYINDKHKALARLNEDHRKIDDINKLFQKCHKQSEICVDMLNKLNFLLPDENKLEPLRNK